MCCGNNGSWLFIILVAIVIVALFGGNTWNRESEGGSNCLGTTSGCGCGCR